MIKLHFYKNMARNRATARGIGPMWKMLQVWQEIGKDLGCDISLEYNPKVVEIDKYRLQCTGQRHDLPARHRTILEVNDKLVYFNCQDQHVVGARLWQVPNLFDLGIHFNYREGTYGRVDFKVSPFTYFTLSDDATLRHYRAIREEIVSSKSFKYSLFWGGQNHSGNKQRKKLSNFIKNRCKMGLAGQSDWDQYYANITNSLCGASARGIGEFCHRDMEFMCIGTPFFRKTYKNQTYNPLIPNVHYYSIGGDEVGLTRITSHYRQYFEPNGELKNFSQSEWDEYREISNNAMSWYDQNASPKASLSLLLKILEENSIL